MKEGASGAPSRRDLQRQETRRRVFEAALSVFRRDGVSGASVEEIARLAGVSRGTFYFHYPTRQDVLVELLVRAEADFVDAIEETPPTAKLAEIFIVIASAIARRWSADPRLFAEVGAVALRRTATQLDVGEKAGLVREALVNRFGLAAGRGELTSSVPPQVLADLFLANTFAVAIGWSTSPERPLEDVLLASAQLFLHGANP